MIELVENFISEKAVIGENVKIWHFAYVGDNTVIGSYVKIGSLAHVDYDVKIGNNTMIEGLVYIPPLTNWKQCFCRTIGLFNK